MLNQQRVLAVTVIAAALLAPAVRPASAHAGAAEHAKHDKATQIIVKVDGTDGYRISDITHAFPVVVDPGGLASRGIYLLTPESRHLRNEGRLKKLARAIAQQPGVVYSEVNLPIQLADSEFYGWPYGSPNDIGTSPSGFLRQPAARQLKLAAAHRSSKGAGVTVAVLDTGADPSAPALAGRLDTGWNYVADDSDTADVAASVGDTAVGHGTFVSGLVALVAPQARIIPEKVLSGQGFGTIYGAAQAIFDATAAGADVINLSFGTAEQPRWDLLEHAIAQAQAAGVIVIAAAGNDGSDRPHYPASQVPTLSVGALDQTADNLTAFSDYGSWVDVAAPGEHVVGPIPGGDYATWAGTSMATPFAAGQAALIRAAAPELSPDQVVAAINDTATPLPDEPIRFGKINIVASLGYAVNRR